MNPKRAAEARRDQAQDGVPVPWLPDRAYLPLDARGEFWADCDVLETIAMDYHGTPPSAAATRILARHMGVLP